MANRNKDAAVSFLKMASSGDVQEAYSKFVGPGFKHHNPYFEGSAETLMTAMEENARENPNKTLDVKRVIADWHEQRGLPLEDGRRRRWAGRKGA